MCTFKNLEEIYFKKILMMTKYFNLYGSFFESSRYFTTEHVKIVKIPGFSSFFSKFRKFQVFCLNCQIPGCSRFFQDSR